jgi:hypothetical protein
VTAQSTWKKSQASVVDALRPQELRQLGRLRCALAVIRKYFNIRAAGGPDADAEADYRD